MILIQNRVKKIKVNNLKLHKMIHTMLTVLNYGSFDIGILLTTNVTIRKFNRNFRKKDQPTDILSFPFHSDLKPGKRIKVMRSEDKNLGDIIISLEYVKEKALEWNRTLDEHLKVLLAHGIAHLLNYDHQSNQDFKVMSKIEKKLLRALE